MKIKRRRESIFLPLLIESDAKFLLCRFIVSPFFFWASSVLTQYSHELRVKNSFFRCQRTRVATTSRAIQWGVGPILVLRMDRFFFNPSTECAYRLNLFRVFCPPFKTTDTHRHARKYYRFHILWCETKKRSLRRFFSFISFFFIFTLYFSLIWNPRRNSD